MGLNASKVVSAAKGDGSKLVPQASFEAGVYPARLVQVLDMGLQAQQPYKGEEKPPVPEIMLTYELVDVFMVDEEGNDVEDRPRWISETIPLHSLKAEKAKSTARYNALDPSGEQGGNFAALVETPINVTIVTEAGKGKHAGKVFANVAGIAAMRPRDAAKCPELKNPPKVFDLDDPDLTIFGSLPEWIQNKIKGNLNYEGSTLARMLGGGAPANKPSAPEVEGQGEDEDRPF